MNDSEGIAREVVQVRDLIAEVAQLQILLVKFTVLNVHLNDVEDVRGVVSLVVL